jgi:hypothetical protein
LVLRFVGAGEIEKMGDGRARQPVFRIIVEEIVETDVKALKTLRIVGKQLDGAAAGDGETMRFERGVSGRRGQTGHGARPLGEIDDSPSV